VFCSLRCRIRAELYEFLIRFPQIIAVMDEIDMYVSQLLLYFLLSVSVPEIIVVDISYAAPQAHGIVNVALHQEYSLGIVFIFSQGRNGLYCV
jgi:hypothetical protein